ncbi:MAG TPA: hypothetical protein VE955_10355 [Candidatus Dormibacteraeota bacterium]|nr:hypothetical protein [Candidatus Dormibacteraeota bacterium]
MSDLGNGIATPPPSKISPPTPMNDGEIISPDEWIGLAKSESNRFLRERVLKLYAKANGLGNITELVEALRSKRLNTYASAKKLMDSLNGMAPKSRAT